MRWSKNAIWRRIVKRVFGWAASDVASFNDIDRGNHRAGYWMLSIFIYTILSFAYNVFVAYHYRTIFGLVASTALMLLCVGTWAYFIRVAYKLALRDWWSIWFSYTVLVRIDRLDIPVVPVEDFDKEIQRKVQTEVPDWCRNNIRGRWCQWRIHGGMLFKFNRKQDAALFKLFWG